MRSIKKLFIIIISIIILFSISSCLTIKSVQEPMRIYWIVYNLPNDYILNNHYMHIYSYFSIKIKSENKDDIITSAGFKNKFIEYYIPTYNNVDYEKSLINYKNYAYSGMSFEPIFYSGIFIGPMEFYYRTKSGKKISEIINIPAPNGEAVDTIALVCSQNVDKNAVNERYAISCYDAIKIPNIKSFNKSADNYSVVFTIDDFRVYSAFINFYNNKDQYIGTFDFYNNLHENHLPNYILNTDGSDNIFQFNPSEIQFINNNLPENISYFRIGVIDGKQYSNQIKKCFDYCSFSFKKDI